MIVLATIGGTGASHLCFLNRYVPIAPISVAMLQNTTSHTIAPPRMLAIIQPTNNPGIAAGVK